MVQVPETVDQEALKALFEQVKDLGLPELADTINGLEGFAWQLNHDAADGRIPDEGIDRSLGEIQKRVHVVAGIFAKKAGISVDDFPTMKVRIKEELAKYEAFLEKKWEKLFQIGAVFKVSGGPFRTDITDLFEVVGIYGTHWSGPEQFIFARTQGTGCFSYYDNRDVVGLHLVNDAPSIYLSDPSFLRSHSDGEFPRNSFDEGIRKSGAVFEYRGKADDPRNGTWETFYDHFCWIGGGYLSAVVIARCQNRPLVAEFTGGDLPRIRLTNKPPHFVKEFIPVLDIGS